MKHWSLATLQNKLIEIGAKVVRHRRYSTIQLAEIAISRELFAEPSVDRRAVAGPRAAITELGAEAPGLQTQGLCECASAP